MGNGILAFMNGTGAGNVNVIDRAGASITALATSGRPNGINATLQGTGNISVTTQGDTIDASSVGVNSQSSDNDGQRGYRFHHS